MHGRLLCWLLLANLIIVSSVHADEKKVEKYPDGTKQRVYTVNADGKKVGAYREFYPNGKLKIQAIYRLDKLTGPYKRLDAKGKPEIQASYRDGELDGVRQEYVDSRLVKEEVWLNGVLLAPRSTTILVADLKAIQAAKIRTVGKPPKVFNATVEQALRDPGLQLKREAALRTLMAYRYLCGLPYRNMTLDWTYTAHDEAGVVLLTQINKMTHTPDNPGLPEDEYRFARDGTGASNLFSDSDMVASVRAYMDDSDAGNIKVVGHRRWCLNPPMAKTGFGGCGKFSAMYSFDGSGNPVPDYNYVAYPPRGFVPVSMFHENYAWSVSLNPSKFQKPSESQVKVGVFPVQFKQREHILERAKTPLPLNFFHVAEDGPGIPYCVIFRPGNFKVVAGATYAVYISGLVDSGGHDNRVEFLVQFVAL